MSEELSARVRNVIFEKTAVVKRFKNLEDMTKISSESWKSVMYKKQRPTAEMIEAVCRRWPQYAFWVATGITDPDYGHVAPRTAQASYNVVRGIEQEHSTQEFLYLINEVEAEPETEEGMQTVLTELVEAVHTQRENDLIKNKYFNFDKAMRGYGEAGRPELYMAEINPVLCELRANRRSQIEDFRRNVIEWRENIYKNIKAEKFFLKFWNVLKGKVTKA
ncbi:hypothetical protein J2X56_003014 [Herbaspirillum sp. 1173]|uniref:hypothetical protein n=1 Tax=Herbaspirillum sp. 1173 TaxID=2817734 RepID=UPI00285AEBE8|nr:hypothetical protein [Herbaspirillum sp. 1173]MDR6740990.1 hypothetical protein [Herbaspirillum sp. 1173]